MRSGEVAGQPSVEGLALLPPVLQLLTDPGRDVTDDTCLEKLLDWLGREMSLPDTGGEVLRHVRPCVLDFLGRVSAARMDVAPCVLSLALRLAGLLGTTDFGFQRLQALGLVDGLFGTLPGPESSPWREAAVRCGWLVGLGSALRHEPAFLWLCQPGNVEVVLSLWKDPSMFVANAANQLLARMLVWGERLGPAAAPPSSPPPSSPAGTPRHNPVLDLVDRSVRSSLRGDDGGEDGIRRALRLLAAWWASGGSVAGAAGLATDAEAENGRSDGTGEDGGRWEAMAAADAWASARRARCRRCWTFTWRCCCGAASLPQASCTCRRCCRRCWNRGTRGTGCRSPPLCRGCPAPSGTQPRRTFTRCCCLCSPPLRRPARRRPRGPPLPPPLPPSAGADGVATWALRHMGTRAGAVGLLCHATHLLSQLAGEERTLGRAEATAATEGVCRVVALSLGLDLPQSPTGGRLALFLIGCSRVQRVGLDCLAALAAPTEGEDALGRAVVKVLLGCLGSPDADPSVIAKAFRALQRWLEPERGPAWLTSDTEDALVRVLALRLEDSRWEVRDSSLEFLAAGVSASPRAAAAAPGSALAPWLARHGLHAGAAWHRLSDAQAYVRASAVVALGAMALGGDGAAWARALAALHLTEDDVLGRLCDILSGDAECFPRRAACRVLTACLRAGGSLRAPLLALASAPPARAGPAGAALRAAARDPDWEVKVNALEFWEAAATLLAREPVGSAGPAAGGPAPALAVLVAALRDCDRPAASKACAALMALADAGVAPARGGAGGDADDEGDASADVTDDLRRLDLPALRDELERRSDYVQSGPASLLRDILASSDSALLDGADCY
ncbi:BRCA1-associated ATM activator 1 [Lethenteron reissneri]|uniref:BRCA1-associated ATM activator 1 n=1 Tax=Lethenteron reissneri TaxID=7753 RepID=UPI002AB60481|nr:BRCA1-associated ATM activator 1 [Lethenteron reissneri]